MRTRKPRAEQLAHERWQMALPLDEVALGGGGLRITTQPRLTYAIGRRGT